MTSSNIPLPISTISTKVSKINKMKLIGRTVPHVDHDDKIAQIAHIFLLLILPKKCSFIGKIIKYRAIRSIFLLGISEHAVQAYVLIFLFICGDVWSVVLQSYSRFRCWY